MRKMSPTIGVAVLSVGLVLASGCAIQIKNNGRVVYENNPQDFFYVGNLKQRALHGDAIAQFTLAGCYANGRGVWQSPTEAVTWYRRSAEQGYAPAQYRLGLCYAYGRGVPQNPMEAVKWYRKAADQGNAEARYNLRFYEASSNGEGGTANVTIPPPPPTVDMLTADEIKSLSIAGQKPEAIIAEIKKTNSKYSSEDIAALQQASVDPDVIKYIQENAAN